MDSPLLFLSASVFISISNSFSRRCASVIDKQTTAGFTTTSAGTAAAAVANGSSGNSPCICNSSSGGGTTTMTRQKWKHLGSKFLPLVSILVEFPKSCSSSSSSSFTFSFCFACSGTSRAALSLLAQPAALYGCLLFCLKPISATHVLRGNLFAGFFWLPLACLLANTTSSFRFHQRSYALERYSRSQRAATLPLFPFKGMDESANGRDA